MTNPRIKLSRDQLYRLLDGHPVQVSTPVGMLEIEGVLNPWTPLRRLPLEDDAAILRESMGLAADVEVWQNPNYEVIVARGHVHRWTPTSTFDTGTDPRRQLWQCECGNEGWTPDPDGPKPPEDGSSGITHLSIKRLDRAPIRNWRHFQQIKNEICGEFTEAIELFPSETRIADSANQYHLWVGPEGFEWPLGFPSGFVADPSGEAPGYSEQWRAGRQEPWEEGLTTGSKMREASRDQVDEARAKIRQATGGRIP